MVGGREICSVEAIFIKPEFYSTLENVLGTAAVTCVCLYAVVGIYGAARALWRTAALRLSPLGTHGRLAPGRRAVSGMRRGQLQMETHLIPDLSINTPFTGLIPAR